MFHVNEGADAAHFLCLCDHTQAKRSFTAAFRAIDFDHTPTWNTADPKRDAYKLFATQFIPRSYVLDRDGKIVYQTVGFGEGAEKAIVEAIDKALAK